MPLLPFGEKSREVETSRHDIASGFTYGLSVQDKESSPAQLRLSEGHT
jgi:hypothetical protein